VTASLLRPPANPADADAATQVAAPDTAPAPAATAVPAGRVGIVVPKHKRSSVARNRLKRRLRELARTLLLPDLPPVDLVVRTFPESYDASFAALEREVRRVRDQVRRLHASQVGQ
jgi:ribonuclease P protein component